MLTLVADRRTASEYMERVHWTGLATGPVVVQVTSPDEELVR